MKRRKFHEDDRSPLSLIKETMDKEDPLYLSYKESIQEKDILKKRKKPVMGGKE